MNAAISKLSHHEQQELCSTRPSYRQGRKLTAVKVYTVSDESTHLLVSRVPAVKLHAELSALCGRFGTVNCCVLVPDYESEEAFVETYHVQYERLQSARFAKRQLDGRSFYGGGLHVCYAPELETVKEARAKLVLRRKEVASRLRKRMKTAATNGTIPLNNSGHFSKSTQPQAVPENSRLPDIFPVQPPPKVHSPPTGQQEMATSLSHLPELSLKPPLPILPKLIPRQVAVSKRIIFHKKS